ncbi:hypothetical protein [Phenylobacterium sp.]|uniref:hypothetical protein n=1 Tax=Phenylobacterium sp. TaxID=1871053 RepID=UPI0025EFC09B|nr:hypothetical protein [Phenylobacterium sp.]
MRDIIILGAAAAALVAGPASAQALQVSYPGDASMTCTALSTEASRMDQLMADANAQVSKANGTAQGANLASTVAVEGMLRTGVLGRVPGAGMFANNMAAAAKQRAAQVQAQAQETIQTATTRKALIAGLYSGKGCDAPPAAPPVPPAETTASPAPTGL